MDGLSPSQTLIQEVVLQLESGRGLASSLRSALPKLPQSLAVEVSSLLIAFESGCKLEPANQKAHPLKIVLFETLWNGLHGAPILCRLEDLSIEAESLAQKDLHQFIARTPIYSLLIVLLIFFPAFLILTLGPILNEMLEALNR